MDFQKELDDIKKLIEEVSKLTKNSLKAGSKPEDLKLEDVDHMLLKIQDLMDKLNNQSEKMLGEMNMTREQVQAYIENPSNFTKEQWELIQFMKSEAEKFQKSIHELLPAVEEGEKERQVVKKKQQAGKAPSRKNWMSS